MCGICAIVDGRPDTEPSESIRAMTRALRHRGPDALAYRRIEGAEVGHTRLSIIDLSGGEQPMSDETSRLHIVFNGEIYNYRELRAELARLGHRFRTHSDTEVILAAYAQWGAQCLDRFRGMYAFAIWNSVERRLFAARDIFGEKPLYFAVTPDWTLLIASEIKALLASRRLGPRIDADMLDRYLALGYVPPDRTIYENIQTLAPGHFLEWDEKGGVRTKCYWRPVFEPRAITIAEAQVRLRELLEQAVRWQMVADVPVGAFLSGGHDSSSIAALMAAQTELPVKTFSVGFGEWTNELPYARAVAELYRTDHHEIDLGMPPVADLLEQMAYVYDEPFMDPSHIPTYLISEYASRSVKVVLTGDGADELFGGYAWYPLFAASTHVSGALLPWLVARSASRLLNDRIDGLARYSRAQGLARRSRDPWERYVRHRAGLDEEARAALWGRRPASNDPAPYYRPENDAGGFDRVLHFDLLSFLPGDILVKVDRAAMAHGLETRAPFLDRDLVEFALSLPANLKVTPTETKVLFKAALRDLWPAALHARGKQGFAAPYRIWLARADVQALIHRVLQPGSALTEVLPGARAAMDIGDYAAWNLLTLGLWLERHSQVELTKAA